MLLNYAALENNNQKEQELVSKAKQGDRDALEQLPEIYKKADRCDSLPKNVSKRLYAFLNLKNPDESIKNYL